eukprot:s6014_g4.t2
MVQRTDSLDCKHGRVLCAGNRRCKLWRSKNAQRELDLMMAAIDLQARLPEQATKDTQLALAIWITDAECTPQRLPELDEEWSQGGLDQAQGSIGGSEGRRSERPSSVSEVSEGWCGCGLLEARPGDCLQFLSSGPFAAVRTAGR